MDSDMSFWDQQFAAPGYKYGEQANQFLRDQASRLKPQSPVLLPGDGEGHNSVWLILEAFHPMQLQHQSGDPKAEAMLYTLAQIRADHQGLAHITRYVAQRA